MSEFSVMQQETTSSYRGCYKGHMRSNKTELLQVNEKSFFIDFNMGGFDVAVNTVKYSYNKFG